MIPMSTFKILMKCTDNWLVWQWNRKRWRQKMRRRKTRETITDSIYAGIKTLLLPTLQTSKTKANSRRMKRPCSKMLRKKIEKPSCVLRACKTR